MNKIVKHLLWLIPALLFLWLILGFCIPKWSIKLSTYQISSGKIDSPIRIVQISDLHCEDFGDKLPALIAEQAPDLILFVGDIVDIDSKDITPTLSTLQELSTIAPLYVSPGNHDWEYQSANNVDLVAAFENAGATVFQATYDEITVKGQTIRLGGIYGYCLPANVEEARERDTLFLTEFQGTSHFTLLMCHMPVCWMINNSLDYWDVDCVLSGHSHGGQVVLPIVGGLYAPDQGWFPGKCSGYWESNSKHLIVTTGLGGNTPVPRFWNRPEVVVVDISPK